MDKRFHFGFQMCLLGEQGVGKTSLIQAATAQKATTTVTLEEEHYTRVIVSAGGTRFRIDIHEVSDVSCLCNASALIVLVINGQDAKSVRNIPYWLNQLGKNVDANRVLVHANRAMGETKTEIQSLVGGCAPLTFIDSLDSVSLLYDACNVIEERIPMPLDAAGMLRTKVSLGPDVLPDLEDVHAAT